MRRLESTVRWTRLPGGVVAAGFVKRVARLLAGGTALPTATPVAAQPSAPAEATTRGDDSFWIAVLPFTHGGTDPDIAALADGLSEGIVIGMSRFSYLRVVARGATLRYGSTATDARSAGRKVRIAVQLVDAGSGAHLWAESYDSAFDPDSVFDLQKDALARGLAAAQRAVEIAPRPSGPLQPVPRRPYCLLTIQGPGGNSRAFFAAVLPRGSRRPRAPPSLDPPGYVWHRPIEGYTSLDQMLRAMFESLEIDETGTGQI